MAQAQTYIYTKTESFRGATVAGFSLGGGADNAATPNAGRAVLTAPATDPAGEGYLRLTTNANYQAGYVVDNTAFSTVAGFSVSFDYCIYGSATTDGDGLAVFFTDGAASAQPFNAGATGGGLGYAQRLWAPVSAGIPHAYLGIGLDTFGNFSDRTDGRTTGPGKMPNAVVVRGPGDGLEGYAFLTNRPVTGFTLAGGGSTRPQPSSTDARYRRAFIDVVPENGAYFLTVRVQHGSTTTTVLANYQVPTPPLTLRAGLAAGTGDNSSVHEVRNLTILAGDALTANQAGSKQLAGLSLYPNPASGNPTLDLSRLPQQPYEVRVVDMLGQQVWQQQAAGGVVNTLRVTGLSAGAYVVLVQGQNLLATLPLICE